MKFLRINKTHTSIDLLPESIQGPKRLRRLVLRLATIQVAIFVCLAFVVLIFNILDQRAWEQSHRLDLRINYLRHGAEFMAVAQAREMHTRLAAGEIFLDANMPAYFDSQWVGAVLTADDGYMTSLDYGGVYIMLAGIVDDISKVEVHRQAVLDTGMFNTVGLGRIVLQDDGRFFYELRVILR